MIDHLEIAQSGYFHQRRHRMSNEAINRLFTTIRAQARRPSQNLFRVDRAVLDDARYSAICFSHERDVSFLAPEAEAVERVYGYVLIVEHGPYIAVFKSGLDLPSAFKTAHLGKVANERIERAIARQDAVFEKLRLRNMSISPLALRSKSLEARDLENTVATSSASRFIPRPIACGAGMASIPPRRPPAEFHGAPTAPGSKRSSPGPSKSRNCFRPMTGRLLGLFENSRARSN